MKIWKNGLNMACFIFLLVLLAVSGGGQRVCANQNNIVISAVSKRGTIPAGVLHRLIALPRLLAAGTRAHVWMIIPVKPLKPGAGPQFLLLSHTINARHGNAGLWKPVSAGTFTGYPVCALAANNPLVGAMKQGVYLFFQNGDGVCFGRKELLRLPAAGGTFSPVAAAGDNGSVYLLVYGVARTTPLQKTSPAQRILRRLKVLESKMMGTTLPTPIVPGSPAAAQAPSSAKAIPSGQPKPAITKNAAASRNLTNFTKAKIATARIAVVKVSAIPQVQMPLPSWHLLQLHDNHWSALPPPILPNKAVNSLVVGRIVMLFMDRHLVVLRLAAGYVLVGQSMDLRNSHPQWSPLTNVSLPGPAMALLGTSFNRHGVLTWIASEPTHRIAISGLSIGINGKNHLCYTRWSKSLLSTIVGSGFSDVAMSRDGDCFTILLRQPGRKLTQYTFNQSGRLLQGPENVLPLTPNNTVSGGYERLILAALIVLLAFSVWRRKEPFAILQVAPKLRVARLYRRFFAAGIDLTIAALVIMLVFHLYSRQDWVKMAAASLDLVFNPQNLLKAPQFLWLLGLYELHVTLAELIFSRSIGKWILGLVVVDMTGQRPRFVALLTRNLFRIPEMIAIVVLVFMFVSPDRQRIGDILGHTVVVQGFR